MQMMINMTKDRVSQIQSSFAIHVTDCLLHSVFSCGCAMVIIFKARHLKQIVHFFLEGGNTLYEGHCDKCWLIVVNYIVIIIGPLTCLLRVTINKINNYLVIRLHLLICYFQIYISNYKNAC